MKRLMRETLTGLITGVICGVTIILIVIAWQGIDQLFLGVVVGVSIMASLIVATIAGSFLPLLMHN